MLCIVEQYGTRGKAFRYHERLRRADGSGTKITKFTKITKT